MDVRQIPTKTKRETETDREREREREREPHQTVFVVRNGFDDAAFPLRLISKEKACHILVVFKEKYNLAKMYGGPTSLNLKFWLPEESVCGWLFGFYGI